ncbi:MAG TPA: glycoside hydrolase family 3 N-terminal domain-containing protein, partial [Jatrophihabitantaceae bacterium]|nr:glycoside hydrolase family 3 N-terminal domain-containing protein [Jatrophihabitantaceae bacterium]
MTRVWRAAAAAAALVLAACGTTTSGHPATTHASEPTTSTTAASPTTPQSSAATPAPPSPRPTEDPAHALFDEMTLAQRVGQLFMVDCPSTRIAAATVSAIQTYHVGAVILDGTSYLSVAQTAALTRQLESDNPSAAKLFVATDQEGGLVQRLRGAGFSSIPSATVQGTFSTATLRADATVWGAELRAAGVTVDLAPVLDTVPAGQGSNPPIGDLDRQYGSDPATVALHGVAVVQGLATAGVDATAKHFPGLGRVTGNTDTTSGVTDDVTTRHDAYLAPFAAAVAADAPFVMISTAIYARIDGTQPAAFSPTVITGMLRGDLGYRGVVISDDLGAAVQVSHYSLGARATAFIAAGGDMVLTVDASQAATMTAAVLARAASDQR